MQIVNLPSEDTPKLKYLADQFTRPDGSLEYTELTRLFNEYIRPIIQARRGKDGTDMLSRMINGKVDNRALTDEEAANLCIQVLVGGLDTVVNFMGFAMLFLAENPTARQTLVADPKCISLAINELARRFLGFKGSESLILSLDPTFLKRPRGCLYTAHYFSRQLRHFL